MAALFPARCIHTLQARALQYMEDAAAYAAGGEDKELAGGEDKELAGGEDKEGLKARFIRLPQSRNHSSPFRLYKRDQEEVHTNANAQDTPRYFSANSLCVSFPSLLLSSIHCLPFRILVTCIAQRVVPLSIGLLAP
ncbi:hypothetical protein cyc_02304 [Cyclospora cayetanensis]|uniref:Uncharacterized protein n=1 Tax=Cyclospora cayetanensis TaxID=88456 RepID=A0A1D3D5F9_9EIME|nr:hypothetical protein cyc_02304 [Cyclospora cayetanensis]